MNIQDKLGTPIEVGSFIAYGHALGRCAALRIGKVLAIEEKPQDYKCPNGVKVVVRGVDDDCLILYDLKLVKPARLLFPDRIIVLAPSRVPETYRQLLEDA